MTGGQREVLFEFVAVGGSMKVTAIDAATAVEVVVVGPVHTPKTDLQRLALRKLEARLARRHAAQGRFARALS